LTPISRETLSLVLPEEAFERIAERAAAMVLERLPGDGVAASPYVNVVEAAEYLRAKPQRVYDLLSSGRLTRHKDGRRVLILRAELDAHAAEQLPRRCPHACKPALRKSSPRE
jgi:excisionase family DNA binding protein